MLLESPRDVWAARKVICDDDDDDEEEEAEEEDECGGGAKAGSLSQPGRGPNATSRQSTFTARHRRVVSRMGHSPFVSLAPAPLFP